MALGMTIQPPLIPAQAGTQEHRIPRRKLGSRFRGNERFGAGEHSQWAVDRNDRETPDSPLLRTVGRQLPTGEWTTASGVPVFVLGWAE